MAKQTDPFPGPGRLALWGVKRPNEQAVIPYLDEQTTRRNCGPAEQVMHRESPAHPWEPVAYHGVRIEPLDRNALREAIAAGSGSVVSDDIRAAIHAGHIGQVTIFCDICGVEETGDYTGETKTIRFAAARRYLAREKGWSTEGDDLCPTCTAAAVNARVDSYVERDEPGRPA